MSVQEAAPAGTAMGAVIRAKIRIPATEGRLERPRLEGLLAGLLARKRCVVVSATPGAGKTTLVAATVQSLGRPVAWLTVDWTDAAPGRLVGYLEATLSEAVPSVAGVARDALAARVPHAEAVALLAEAAAGQRVVLVLDELERLGDAPDAWAVIGSLLRHLPDDMGVVLCCRRPLPDSVLPGAFGRIGDEELALTVAEADALLERQGEADVDTTAVVHATGGWLTGVLFHAWQFGEHVAGEGGGSDPLHGYLSAHILEELSPGDRDFLIATSLLRLVSAERAGALGLTDSATRLASLRKEHIPAAWQDGGAVLRCHPSFREYLQECLEGWDPDRVRALRLAHGHLLMREGYDEMAAEVMLLAGSPADALEPAARAIFDVINRLDFDVAERWLSALAPVEMAGMSPFVMARLMIALANEDHGRGLELIDQLAARGRLAEVVASSSALALMVGQCLVMAGRYDNLTMLLEQAPRDADYEMLRQYVYVYGYEPRPPRPETACRSGRRRGSRGPRSRSR